MPRYRTRRDGDGFTLTSEARRAHPELRALVSTSGHFDDALPTVSKPFTPATLLASVEAVLRTDDVQRRPSAEG